MRVEVGDEGYVRVITLSHPSKKNALTRSMLTALVEALPGDRDETRPEVRSHSLRPRAVVLRGDPAGGAFSSGFDIDGIDPAERARGLDPIDGPARAIESCSVPVIAAVDDLAYGGAFELVMACDLRVVSASARFCMPPAKLGLMYSPTGLRRFLRVARTSACLRIFLTGDVCSASTLFHYGLVDEVVPGAAFETAMRWADAIASNAPLAIEGILKAGRQLGATAELDESAWHALEDLRARTLSSRDLDEGLRAFREKRRPRFEGG